MEVTFKEVKQDDPKIRFGQGGYRPNSGPKPYSDRKRAFFMLSREMSDQLHTLTARTMSKFVIEVLDCYEWGDVQPSNPDTSHLTVPFHIRLPEKIVTKLSRLPQADKSFHLNECLKEQFSLVE
jgi:hypothetical protein